MSERTYTVLCPFSGLGGGALGFLQAETRLLGITARFRCIGGIDFDAEACADFEALTGSRALCTDVAKLTVDELRAFAGTEAPDVVFMSPPCKGASGLLSKKKANTAKYRQMNRLALDWTRLMLETWRDSPPRLVLLENVPRLKQRASRMLRAARAYLHRAGYVFTDGYHDCGELGGLAQKRRRYLLVARHAGRVKPLLYKPPKKRVRACGEVLETLPMPTTPEAAEYGRLHELPRLSWMNWVRLAMIPAGGDWRDIPGVLAELQKRRELHRRHHVEGWSDPSVTVAGSGSNGPSAVADPRVDEEQYRGRLGVRPWDEVSATVTGNARPVTGRFAVADPRAFEGFADSLGVRAWDEPSGTVTGQARPSTGRFSVGDPRAFREGYGVLGFDETAGTITGEASVSGGRFAVADPRVRAFGGLAFELSGMRPPAGGWASAIPQAGNPNMHWGKYDVRGWDETAATVTGAGRVGSGAPSVADPRAAERFGNVERVSPWDAPTGTVTHSPAPSSGAPAAADPRARNWFGNVLRVIPWPSPAGTVTGGSGPTNGGGVVADPRVGVAFDHGYRVLTWEEPSFTIAGGSMPGQGAYSVGDPRVTSNPRPGAYGVIDWKGAAATVTGHAGIDNGRFAVTDPRIPHVPLMVIEDTTKPPPAVPVIMSEDGTWHRPLTTLELAALQGLPTRMPDGSPLRLVGPSSSRHRERIGNAVPPPAAEAIANRMLVALVEADVNAFSLRADGDVWVRPPAAEVRA